MESPIKIQDAHPEKPVRGAWFLRHLEDLFLRADRLVSKLIPAHLNPLTQCGALANMSFLIALASGVLLLFWYVPSVHQAWESLENMSWLGQMVRSLHRYSSDATLFFVLIHAVRMGVGGRFGGARWIAWVSGIVLIGFLWAIGWMGYWLVWDVRAQTLAIGTAQILEFIPIFTEPMSRTFLTDEGVSTGLFFMIFFFHMMLPLAMGVALWIHISRMNRAKFLTSLPMGLWLTATLFVVALVFPATSAEQAKMAVHAQEFTSDWWYLLPMALTERLSGGLLVALLLGGTSLLLTIPWWMTRGIIQKAVVDTDHCNGCARCVDDCPYNAIVMVARSDGHPRYELQAEVDPDKCVGCGICAGSCNPGGIGLPQLPVQDERRRIDQWIDQVLAQNDAPCIAFLCASSAAADFQVAQDGRCSQLEGWRVMAVPCTGWVQALTLERALRRGAKHILIVGCTREDPHYREGVKWTELRLGGEREPVLRRNKINAEGVHFVTYNRSEKQRFIAAATALRNAEPGEISAPRAPEYSRARQIFGGIIVAAALAIPLALLSDAPSLVPTSRTPELVVSVKYRPNSVRDCRPMTEAEKASTPKHMRSADATICERNLPDVRVGIWIDGVEQVQRVYAAKGLSSDGPSIGTEYIELSPGLHRVSVRIGNTAEPGTWSDQWEGELNFEVGRRQVILYENREGFIIAR